MNPNFLVVVYLFIIFGSEKLNQQDVDLCSVKLSTSHRDNIALCVEDLIGNIWTLRKIID